MFVFHCKPLRHKRVFFSLIAVTAAAALCCTVLSVCRRDTPKSSAKAGDREYSTVIKDGGYSAFFAQLGLDADNAPVTEKAVTIPDGFNQTYEAYNVLQKHAGLDLSPYKGKRATLMTFQLRGAAANTAVLLVKDGRVIGGHLTNGEYGSEDLPLI